jgi:hypothetical protein
MAFTEQGVAMLSSVLRSKRAIQVNIQIMRAFMQLRRMLSTHKDLKNKIEAMEKKYDNVWYVSYRKTTGIGGDVSGKVSKGMLVLHGKCTRRGGEVVRVIENE